MRQEFKKDGSEIVQVPITAAQTNPIGLNTKLDKKFICAIEFNGSLTKTPLGKATLGTTTAAAKTVSYLTIKGIDGKEFINLLPLNTIDSLAGQNAGIFVFDTPAQIDIQNSYITIGDVSTIPVGGEVAVFTFYYLNNAPKAK